MQEMKVGPSMAKEHLLRPQTGQRMKLKEMFVEIYDMFLRGQDPAQGKDSDVFWDELFLIKVNAEYLTTSLRQISEDQLLAIKDAINNIFLHAVQTMRDPLPQRRLHAMQTLTIVLGEIFRKKFHNWSFDVIHLLTGLSHADLVFRTLLEGLSTILGGDESVELRVAALRLATALACGNDNVNKNSLNEYFMQKDLFPSLIKFFASVESVDLAFEIMALLGLLSNYNKYETRNPYLAHLAAIKDEETLKKMTMVIVQTCDSLRRGYTDVVDDDDVSTVSKVASAFSYVTGMLWNPKGQDSAITGAAFALLPDGRVTILLTFYDLIYTNKRFFKVFMTYSTSLGSGNAPVGAPKEGPASNGVSALGSFLSFASYLFQHNRTHRTAPYTHLCLIIILLLVEDPASYQYLCSIPSSGDSPSLPIVAAEPITTIRLCRQRQPVLPKVRQARPMAAVLMDVILGFLKHNMKKKMQVDCFRIAVSIIFSIACRFKALRVRLTYHWVEMWNTLLNLIKFLQGNAKAFQMHNEARDLVAEAIDLVNYFVTYGDLIMADPASLYALYYEVVRSGIDVFSYLTKEFSISVHPPLPAPLPHHDLTSRNRLNLAASPVTSPAESLLGSPPPPAPMSLLGSPPSSPYYHRSGSPSNALPSHLGQHHQQQHQRSIVIDLSNINQVYAFFFTHLLTWRDANPTRSMGPDLVSTIIKNHYQDLTLMPIALDPKHMVGGYTHHGNGRSGLQAGPGPGSGPGKVGSPLSLGAAHPGWELYAEVPGKVHFFRLLTRWIVSDLRDVSRANAAAAAAVPALRTL